MKFSKLFTLLIILIAIIDCQSHNNKKSQKTIIKQPTKANLIIDFDVNDIPSGINIEYSRKNLLFIGPLFSEGNLSPFFLRFDLNKKSADLLGNPGQDETSTQFYESLGIIDNEDYLFVAQKGWVKFFDLDGRFLYSIYSPYIQNGDAFFLQDKLVSFPSWLNPSNNYLLTYVSMQNTKKGGKRIKLKKFVTMCFEKPEKQIKHNTTFEKNNNITHSKHIIYPVIAKKINEDSCAILLVKNDVENLIYYHFSENKLIKINIKKYLLPFTKEKFIKRFALINSLDTFKGDVFVGINLLLRSCFFGNNSPFCYIFLRFNSKGEITGIYSHPVKLYPEKENAILLDFEVCKLKEKEAYFLVNEWVSPITKKGNTIKIKKEKKQRIIMFKGIFFKNIEQLEKERSFHI